MEPEDSKNTTRSPRGYGKRPMWQWVVIYLLVAILVYGLIYYLFIRGTGGY